MISFNNIGTALEDARDAALLLTTPMIALGAANGFVVIQAPLWLNLPLTGLGIIGYGATATAFILGLGCACSALKTLLA